MNIFTILMVSENSTTLALLKINVFLGLALGITFKCYPSLAKGLTLINP